MLYQSREFILEYTKKLFRMAIDKFSNEPMFYMSYGVFLIKEFDNIMAAYFYLNYAEEISDDLGELFKAFIAKYQPLLPPMLILLLGGCLATRSRV